MAVGNTFGATALSSYGGFWISFAIILTPGGFQIESTLEGVGPNEFADEFGLYLIVCTIFCPPSLHMRASRTLSFPMCFDMPLTPLPLPGLVHLHLPPRALHSSLYCRLLHPLLLPRHGFHATRHRLPPPRRHGYAQPAHPQSRRIFRAVGGVHGLVQRAGRYCR